MQRKTRKAKSHMENYFSALQDQFFIQNNFGTYKSSILGKMALRKKTTNTLQTCKSQCLDLCAVDLLRLSVRICTACTNLLYSRSVAVINLCSSHVWPVCCCLTVVRIRTNVRICCTVLCTLPRFVCSCSFPVLSRLITHSL
jgi:hypothetical protein